MVILPFRCAQVVGQAPPKNYQGGRGQGRCHRGTVFTSKRVHKCNSRSTSREHAARQISKCTETRVQILKYQIDCERKRKAKESAPVVDMSLRPGLRTVGRYEILETLGTGYSGKWAPDTQELEVVLHSLHRTDTLKFRGYGEAMPCLYLLVWRMTKCKMLFLLKDPSKTTYFWVVGGKLFDNTKIESCGATRSWKRSEPDIAKSEHLILGVGGRHVCIENTRLNTRDMAGYAVPWTCCVANT